MGVTAADPPRSLDARWALLLTSACFVLLVLRVGWLSDDAFITARMWDSAWSGQGLGLNAGERVLATTSPLLLLLGLPLYGVVGDPYATLMLLSLGATGGFVAVVVAAHWQTPLRGALVFAALSASYSVLSFATSGLENPFGFLIFAAFAVERLARRGASTRVGWLLAAAAVLCRQDYALLAAPVLALAVAGAPRKAALDALPGALVLLSWFAFAVFYFGFALPNTAYAKLNVSVPRLLLVGQAAAYVLDSAHRDPWVLVGLLATLTAAARPGLSAVGRLLLSGTALYLAYLVWIGGDFMGGRFFTVPYVIGVVVLGRELPLGRRAALGLAALLAVIVAPRLAYRDPNHLDSACSGSANGVVDERACYAEHTNLAENLTTSKWRTHNYLKEYAKVARAEASSVLVFNLIGMAPFAEGAPEKHIVEPWSLGDPLLARLRYADKKARPGHYPRRLPAGYVESLREGKNVIADPCVRRLHDRLTLATRAPLFAPGRLGAILALNFLEPTCPMP